VNPLEAAFRRVASDLGRRGFAWALVGGFAVSARAVPRFTHDIDIAAMVVDDHAAEELVRSLMADGYGFFASVEHENGRLATVRLKRQVEGVAIVVDLLFASSGIEPEVVQAAEQLEIFPGLVLPVASTGHLIALKLLARDDVTRPQDLADLRGLIEAATPADIKGVRDAVDLITERGFNRDRDLPGSLNALLSSLGH